MTASKPSSSVSSRPVAGRDASTGQARYCEACRVEMPRGPDACLGYLPGVIHACCGHGGLTQPYVCIAPGYDPNTGWAWIPDEDKIDFRGDDALRIFEYLKA